MSRRYSLSNAALDNAIQGTSWTREVPFKFLRSSLPDLTPARESDRGRGAPVYDLYGHLDGTEIGVSFKVSAEDRNPRNLPVTTGKPEHIAGLYSAVKGGTMIPLWGYNFNKTTGSWTEVKLMACEVLKKEEVWLSESFHKHPDLRDSLIEALRAEGVIVKVKNGRKSVPVSVSLARRQSGRNPDGSPAHRFYMTLRVNLAPLGVGWSPSEGPSVPESWEDFGDELVG